MRLLYGRERRFLWTIAGLVAIFICTSSHAQRRNILWTTESPQPVSSGTENRAVPPAHMLTPDDLATFSAGLFPLMLQQQNIAGAALTLVRDGDLLFAQGYGEANVQSKIPFTPDQTLVRAGSISKLFTWVAVMQQVEQGRIDLDQDVNAYLDFKIPATFPKPVTMRDLMTYTPGFEDVWKDLIVSHASSPEPLGRYLKTHLPARVYPPGEIPAYSNYASALAGYIVERVSGEPFSVYVQHHLFEPLGMSHSTFEQPLPAALQPALAAGYGLASSSPEPFEVVSAVPAAGASTTAQDGARFLLALLGDGTWNHATVLSPHTTQEMLANNFGVMPGLPQMTLGFDEERRNGLRLLGHGGDTQYFHSDLVLIPELHLGYFLTFNSAGRGDYNPREYFRRAFLDRYFPFRSPAVARPAFAIADAHLVAGEYVNSRRPVTSILSFTSLFTNVRVAALGNGDIVVDHFTGVDGLPKVWQEIGPLLYQEEKGQERLGFFRGPGNAMTLATNVPFFDWSRVSLFDTKAFNFVMACFGVLGSILVIVLWPTSALLRRYYAQTSRLSVQEIRVDRVGRVVATTTLIYLSLWIALLASHGGAPLFDSATDSVFRVLQALAWCEVLGTVLVIAMLAWDRHKGLQRWGTTARQSVMATGFLAFAFFLLHWHLLQLNLHF